MLRRILLVLVILIAIVVALVAIARLTSKSVDGIPCDASEAVAYHVHAHLTIVVGGTRLYYPPANIGIEALHLCFYWLHTHDATGIIHIEAPHRIRPTLGQFFDIWGQPLSRRRIWRWNAPAGAEIRYFVGRARYTGNPRAIPLLFHTAITAEVGPPFIPPPPANFQGL